MGKSRRIVRKSRKTQSRRLSGGFFGKLFEGFQTRGAVAPGQSANQNAATNMKQGVATSANSGRTVVPVSTGGPSVSGGIPASALPAVSSGRTGTTTSNVPVSSTGSGAKLRGGARKSRKSRKARKMSRRH